MSGIGTTGTKAVGFDRVATIRHQSPVSRNMSALATLVRWIVMVASIVGSVETIIRLARFAWSLVLRLTGRSKFAPAFRFARA